MVPRIHCIDDAGYKLKVWHQLGRLFLMVGGAKVLGSSLSYPADKADITGVDYEPWHFRYVGMEHAPAIHESGLCLGEHLDAQEQGSVPASSNYLASRGLL